VTVHRAHGVWLAVRRPRVAWRRRVTPQDRGIRVGAETDVLHGCIRARTAATERDGRAVVVARTTRKIGHSQIDTYAPALDAIGPGHGRKRRAILRWTRRTRHARAHRLRVRSLLGFCIEAPRIGSRADAAAFGNELTIAARLALRRTAILPAAVARRAYQDSRVRAGVGFAVGPGARTQRTRADQQRERDCVTLCHPGHIWQTYSSFRAAAISCCRARPCDLPDLRRRAPWPPARRRT
jgi:hypothetical protein